MQKVKLIWDFNGLEAHKTSEHFKIHLIEFLNSHEILDFITKVEAINEFHSISFLIIDEGYVKIIKNALKPNRAYFV